MGGNTISTEQQKIANIALQTSSYGLTLPKIYGTQRVSGNLIWYGNFNAVPHTTTTSSGGKGVGKVTQKDTTYTYTAAVMMALAEGPITGVGAVWKGKDKISLSDLGLTLFTGTPTQATWSFLTSYNVPGNWAREAAYGYKDWYTNFTAPFTDQAINYSSTAYLASSAYDLGTDASVPNHGFEILGSLIYPGQSDANPGDIIPDMLTSQQYGSGFPPGMIGSMTAYTQYCVANSLFVSPAYTEQRSAADCLKELTDLTNSAVVWSAGLLKVIPYGDVTLTGNGQTYTPNMTPLYDLGDDDFLASTGGDPVRVKRSSPADAKNRITLEFSNRVNQYNTEVVAVEDQDAIEKYGLKPAENISAHMFCLPTAAKMAAQLQLQRLLYKRNTYYFGLNARYAMLEPMDIVTITDTGLGMTRVAVRIIEITEIDDGYDVVAEDLNIGVANAASYAHDSGLRWQMTVNATPSPVNAPYIFELPADPTTTGLAIGIAVGGSISDPFYGGCRVWVSLDGTNYRTVGTIYGSSRYGVLIAPYPAATGTDNSNTMKVNLISGGQLISGSAKDAENAATLCVVDNEFVAYQTATLVDVGKYDLKPVNRGLYSTTGATHNTGSKWARIDQAIHKLTDLDLSLIGKMIYIKCTAFNAYGSGEQDLSSAVAYAYVITGWAKELKTPEPGVYLDVIASRSQITYDGTGTPAPTTQTTAFDVLKQGFSSPVVLVMTKADGTLINNPQSYLTPVTPTAINLIPYSDQFSSWSGSATVDSDFATAPDGSPTADRLTDANGSGFEGRQQSIAIPADGTIYICSWFLKKTTGASNSVALRVNLQGGTAQVNRDVYVNTNAGTIRLLGGASGTIRSIGDYWLIQSTVTNNGTNTGLDLLVFPAIGFNVDDQPASSLDAGATGSAIVWRASASYSYEGYLIGTGTASRRGIVTDNASLTEPNFASAASGNTGVRVVALAGEPTGVLTDVAALYRNDAGADGTDGLDAITVSPGSQAFVISATSSGSPKTGQLPKTVTFMVLAGASDVSDDTATTYSVVASACTATLGGTNNKVLTIPALSADTATATVTIQRSGVTVATVLVSLTKARDGSTGGTSARDDTLAINNTSSYSGTQGGPLTLMVGPNGTITLDVDMGYTVASISATVNGKVQYRTTPGTGGWTDIGTEASGYMAIPGEPGQLAFQRTLAGPSVAANWEFQFVNRKVGAGTAVLDTSNDVFQVSWGAS